MWNSQIFKVCKLRLLIKPVAALGKFWNPRIGLNLLD